MHMKNHMSLRCAIAAVALAAAGTAAAGSGGGYDRIQGPSILEGAWEVAISPANCDTGEPLSANPILSYLTFASGGALIEATSNPFFQPGQRTGGQGYWERITRKTFHAHFQAFVLFDSAPTPPYYRGTQTVDQDIEMVDSNHWKSTAQVTFRNPAGDTVPPSGCAAAAAARMP
jgi:hypothetical protein